MKVKAEPDSKSMPISKEKEQDRTKKKNNEMRKRKTNEGTVDCSHVLITSTGGVGSSRFIKTMGTILKNQSRMKVNHLKDADGFSNKPATLVKDHNLIILSSPTKPTDRPVSIRH